MAPPRLLRAWLTKVWQPSPLPCAFVLISIRWLANSSNSIPASRYGFASAYNDAMLCYFIYGGDCYRSPGVRSTASFACFYLFQLVANYQSQLTATISGNGVQMQPAAAALGLCCPAIFRYTSSQWRVSFVLTCFDRLLRPAPTLAWGTTWLMYDAQRCSNIDVIYSYCTCSVPSDASLALVPLVGER